MAGDIPFSELPPGHFLALPPTFSNDPRTSHTTTSHAAPGLAPNVASLAAADFDVDVRTGFLPPSANVARLPAPYDVWEDALDAAAGTKVGEGLRLGGGRPREEAWRKAVDSIPVLGLDELSNLGLPYLRRGHLVLAFLAHFYVHSAHAPAANKPIPVAAPISVPLLAISPLVGLPPVLTYADTVLWNVHAQNTSIPININTNPPIETLATFTHTRSEAMFYLVSAECEAAGSAALTLMRQCLDELFLADEIALKRLTVYLRQLAVLIDRVGDITLRMNTEVDPEEFYHLIRPWFKGGDADGPTSPGWLFLGVDEGAGPAAAENTLAPPSASGGRKFSGPSAGQSSLVHAFDIFLTVDHSERDDESTNRRSGSDRGDAAARPDAKIRFNAGPLRPPATGAGKASRNSGDSVPVPVPAHRAGPAVGPPGASAGGPPAHVLAAMEQPGGPVEATFLHRMLEYMPLPHRTFLLHLSTHPTPLREVVLAHMDTHPALSDAYDGALSALRRFRDKHMRVVSRFIVVQARRAPSDRMRELLQRQDEVGLEAVDENRFEADELRGTGGTPLIRFLKRCRDNTSMAMVNSR